MSLHDSVVSTDPAQPVAGLPLLTEAERRRLHEWNATWADYPRDQCIHQLFEAQVARTPDAVAVACEGEQWTYRELNARANQLGRHLVTLGLGRGDLIGVHLNRSLEMIAALLGILKVGAAYVPLEVGYPPSRLHWILTSLSIRCLVTQEAHLSTLDTLDSLPTLRHVVCLSPSTSRAGDSADLDEPALRPHSTLGSQVWTWTEVTRQSQANLALDMSPQELAYIIFTSGSTGTPKGVMVCHRPVINLIDWVNQTFGIGNDDRVLFVTALSFDLSVYDIFGLLAAGGAIHVVPDQDVRNPERLLDLLEAESITFWDSAPAALQQLVPFLKERAIPEVSRALRLIFLSGDWIPVRLPDQIRAHFPEVPLVSLGGATEATVWSNYFPIEKVDPNWVSIPYGKPIQNARYYILDSHMNPCSIGVSGDLYIGGECLSLGYVNEPSLTAEKYVPDPYGTAFRRII